MLEATYLVMNRFVWVHTVAIGGETRVSCIVAFTRNSDRVATITKVGWVFMNNVPFSYRPSSILHSGLYPSSIPRSRYCREACAPSLHAVSANSSLELHGILRVGYLRLLLTSNLGAISLFVGVANRAAIVYNRVGFLGLNPNSPPVPGVETWIEIGFDRQHVHLGHW